MTNKVKPFFIRITEDMTPQMVQDAFDKCVDAGAKLGEGCLGVKSKHEYKEQYNPSNFKFFGVDDSFVTYMDSDLEYFTAAQEITLDQLDEWLGLEVEEDWDGEGLPPVGFECELELPQLYEAIKIKVVGHIKDVCNDDIVFYEIKSRDECEFKYGWCHASSARFIKPETPEQKAERERLEAIDSMFTELNLDEERELNEDDRESIYWKSCEVAYDAGYRKQ